MTNKILKTLSNNWAFKLLAFAFAFILWLMVYNLEDPTKTETMTLQVSLINKESVESLNKYYEVINESNKVTFSVTAPRSVLDKLDEKDFTAVADLEYLVINEDGLTGTAPIEIRCTASDKDSIKLSATRKTLHVKLENLMSKQFIVTPNAIGEVADGYALGTVAVTAPNVLKVSGPESIVKTIASVIATIDVSDMSMDVTDNVLPVLYDSKGQEIDTTRLSMSNTTVNVAANILKTKAVPIALKPSGTPANGYMVTSIVSTPTTILLKGNSTALNSISAIEIPSDLVKIEGATGDVTATIDILDYLPYGVELVNKEEATVTITVEIGKIRNKVFSVETDNIIVTGLPTGYQAEFVHTSVAVTISGLETDIIALGETQIGGSIDVTDLEPGTHVLKLTLDIDGTKYNYQDVTVTVNISEKTGSTDPGTEVPGTEDTETGTGAENGSGSGTETGTTTGNGQN